MTPTFGFNFSDTYSQLPKDFLKKAELYSFENPQHQMFNSSLALSLGLDENAIKQSNYIFANGNNLPHGSSSIAQAYCGHQFVHFVKLGDGRALLLGEHVTSDQKRYDIQLKGSGPTEFSRGGDGFAALGPMLREYLISESIQLKKVLIFFSSVFTIIFDHIDIMNHTFIKSCFCNFNKFWILP